GGARRGSGAGGGGGWGGGRWGGGGGDSGTGVGVRRLREAEVGAYVRADTPYEVAGGARSEGLGIALRDGIDSSDPTALVGLPLIALTRMLRAADYPLFATTRGDRA
ncbi:hypothetical protein DWU95_38560, partial [Burkholderia contaminans]